MFLIRENAMKILVYAYSHCDSLFRCSKINCKNIVDKNATSEDVSKCKKYLIDSHYISANDIWDCVDFDLLPKGIDAAENIIKTEKTK